MFSFVLPLLVICCPVTRAFLLSVPEEGVVIDFHGNSMSIKIDQKIEEKQISDIFVGVNHVTHATLTTDPKIWCYESHRCRVLVIYEDNRQHAFYWYHHWHVVRAEQSVAESKPIHAIDTQRLPDVLASNRPNAPPMPGQEPKPIGSDHRTRAINTSSYGAEDRVKIEAPNVTIGSAIVTTEVMNNETAMILTSEVTSIETEVTKSSQDSTLKGHDMQFNVRNKSSVDVEAASNEPNVSLTPVPTGQEPKPIGSDHRLRAMNTSSLPNVLAINEPIVSPKPVSTGQEPMPSGSDHHPRAINISSYGVEDRVKIEAPNVTIGSDMLTTEVLNNKTVMLSTPEVTSIGIDWKLLATKTYKTSTTTEFVTDVGTAQTTEEVKNESLPDLTKPDKSSERIDTRLASAIVAVIAVLGVGLAFVLYWRNRRTRRYSVLRNQESNAHED